MSLVKPKPAARAITLVLADDHPLYLDGLEMLFTCDGTIDVVAKFGSGHETIEALKHLTCDILLLDLHLLDMNGLETVEKILLTKPDQKIVMLTHQKGSRYFPKLKQMGIKGYVLKNIPFPDLVAALRTVHAGGTYFSDGIEQLSKEEDFYISSSVIINQNTPEMILTSREIEILVKVCNEMSSAAIAQELFISTSTVDTHRKNIMQKLGVINTVGLVKYALKHKLLMPPE